MYLAQSGLLTPGSVGLKASPENGLSFCTNILVTSLAHGITTENTNETNTYLHIHTP